MSEFFEGLAARSAGTATALRPRAASAYEHRDAIGVVGEVPATLPTNAPAVIPPSSREVRAAQSMPIDSPTVPAEPMVVRNVVLTRTETDGPAAESARDVRAGERIEERVQRVREHTHHEQIRIARVRELLADSHEHQPDPRADPQAETRGTLAEEGSAEQRPAEQRASPLPAAERRPLSRRNLGVPLVTTDHRQPFPSSQPPADPIVRITIGRVEVRAVQPAQPAPRPAPPPVAAGPTLAEFLEQRERRK